MCYSVFIKTTSLKVEKPPSPLTCLSADRWERVGVRANTALFHMLTSPSPLSPPTRGGEIRLYECICLKLPRISSALQNKAFSWQVSCFKKLYCQTTYLFLSTDGNAVLTH